MGDESLRVKSSATNLSFSGEPGPGTTVFVAKKDIETMTTHETARAYSGEDNWKGPPPVRCALGVDVELYAAPVIPPPPRPVRGCDHNYRRQADRDTRVTGDWMPGGGWILDKDGNHQLDARGRPRSTGDGFRFNRRGNRTLHYECTVCGGRAKKKLGAPDWVIGRGPPSSHMRVDGYSGLWPKETGEWLVAMSKGEAMTIEPKVKERATTELERAVLDHLAGYFRSASLGAEHFGAAPVDAIETAMSVFTAVAGYPPDRLPWLAEVKHLCAMLAGAHNEQLSWEAFCKRNPDHVAKLSPWAHVAAPDILKRGQPGRGGKGEGSYRTLAVEAMNRQREAEGLEPIGNKHIKAAFAVGP